MFATIGTPRGTTTVPAVPTTATAPSDVVGAVRQVVGVDVGDVPIRRGPEVSATARALNARAFTTQGEVHLPAEAGQLDTQPARALLAHELVHAAQQRTFGAQLPPESSPDGQALENVAVATERWVRGEGTPPPALVHRPPATDSGMVTAAIEETRRLALQVDQLAMAQAQAFVTPPVAPPTMPDPSVVQRAPDTEAPPTPGPVFQSVSPTAVAPVSTGTPVASWSLFDVPPEPESPSLDGGPEVARLRAAVEDLRQSISTLTGRPEPAIPDLADRDTLDDLATKLFGRFRSRLRRELLVDRERAGRLSDFR